MYFTIFTRRALIYSTLMMNSNNNNYIWKSPINGEKDNDSAIIFRNENTLHFYGTINDESCFKLKCNLEKMIDEKSNDNIPINLHLQTNGGSVLPSFSVVDYISKNNINTYVEGYVGSAGTLLSVSGKKRFMTKNSLMLIHSLRMELNAVDFNDISDIYNNAITITNNIRNIYNDNTKIPKDKLDYYLNHNIWINAEECLKYSIIDQII